MNPSAKPRHRSGYSSEETELVRSACLTIAVTLGALMDDLCVVGGLVPALLIDQQVNPGPGIEDRHSGTNDLDIGLAIGLLDEQQYTQISNRLRQEGFKPDQDEAGNRTPQRWTSAGVTVDFLIPPVPGAVRASRIHYLEADFGALITPGLELVFSERINVSLEGRTLSGEAARRDVPVSGPAAFVVLKALAFANRGEPKDAYDLIYVLRRWPGGVDDIASRLARHAVIHRLTVEAALAKLIESFASPDDIGPLRAAAFDANLADDRDAAVADAFGYVDDLICACSARGLTES